MKHILIMEDNTSLALDWKNAFELNGFKITLSRDGNEALTCFIAPASNG